MGDDLFGLHFFMATVRMMSYYFRSSDLARVPVERSLYRKRLVEMETQSMPVKARRSDEIRK